jgi:hypothetical protein
MRFWKRKQANEAKPETEVLQEPHIEDLNDYVRFVEHGEAWSFLDVDTSLTIEIRDIISDFMREGKYSEDELAQIAKIDTLFRTKVAISAQSCRDEIENGSKKERYLRMLLRSMEYPHIKDTSKWWYRLLESSPDQTDQPCNQDGSHK